MQNVRGSVFPEIEVKFREVGLIVVGNKKIFFKVLTATKLNSSQRKSKNTQNFSSMGIKR